MAVPVAPDDVVDHAWELLDQGLAEEEVERMLLRMVMPGGQDGLRHAEELRAGHLRRGFEAHEDLGQPAGGDGADGAADLGQQVEHPEAGAEYGYQCPLSAQRRDLEWSAPDATAVQVLEEEASQLREALATCARSEDHMARLARKLQRDLSKRDLRIRELEARLRPEPAAAGPQGEGQEGCRGSSRHVRRRHLLKRPPSDERVKAKGKDEGKGKVRKHDLEANRRRQQEAVNSEEAEQNSEEAEQSRPLEQVGVSPQVPLQARQGEAIGGEAPSLAAAVAAAKARQEGLRSRRGGGSCVPGVRWDEGNKAWVASWPEARPDHSRGQTLVRQFPILRYLEDGKTEAEASAEAMQEAIVFREGLVLRGLVKVANVGSSKGIVWNRQHGSWDIFIRVYGKKLRGGRFRPVDGTPEASEKARQAAVALQEHLELRYGRHGPEVQRRVLQLAGQGAAADVAQA